MPSCHGDLNVGSTWATAGSWTRSPDSVGQVMHPGDCGSPLRLCTSPRGIRPDCCRCLPCSPGTSPTSSDGQLPGHERALEPWPLGACNLVNPWRSPLRRVVPAQGGCRTATTRRGSAVLWPNPGFDSILGRGCERHLQRARRTARLNQASGRSAAKCGAGQVDQAANSALSCARSGAATQESIVN